MWQYFNYCFLALATLKPQAGISNIPAPAVSKPKEAVAAPAAPKVGKVLLFVNILCIMHMVGLALKVDLNCL